MLHSRDRFSKFFLTVNSGAYGISGVQRIPHFMANFKGEYMVLAINCMNVYHCYIIAFISGMSWQL